ncbi:hypothetical protein [Lentzea sp. NBRC 102530]|uniref:hypothetical protein n=1 Tax=Lentzea sp. NBRC 102530 TaxID=3032201 RepID=UPI0024A14C24|nr:hypothetical protein [Lentzea sp. NBRC 102530]GLY54850.1 hypothetical protein Lesp01_85050 [Lentzea sp. NBRC 102530]
MSKTAFLEKERARITDEFATVERLEGLADDLSGEPLAELQDIVHTLLGRIPPVRVQIAAGLLCLAQSTVSRWANAGLLAQVDVPNSSVVHLDPHHLHEVMHLLRAVRDKGEKNPDFTKHLRWALQDRQLAQSHAVTQGLAELDRGEYVDL